MHPRQMNEMINRRKKFLTTQRFSIINLVELAHPEKVNKKLAILFNFPNYEYGEAGTTFYVYITFGSREAYEGKNPNFHKVEFFPELEIS